MTQEQIAEIKKFCIEQVNKYSSDVESLLQDANKLYEFIIKTS